MNIYYINNPEPAIIKAIIAASQKLADKTLVIIGSKQESFVSLCKIRSQAPREGHVVMTATKTFQDSQHQHRAQHHATKV